MIFPNGQMKKRKFPLGPTPTDQEIELDEEYQKLIKQCKSRKQKIPTVL